MVLHPALGEYDQWHPSDNKSGSYFRLIPYAVELGEQAWMNFAAFFRLMDHWGMPRSMVTEGVGGMHEGPLDGKILKRRVLQKLGIMLKKPFFDLRGVARINSEFRRLDRELDRSKTLVQLYETNVQALEFSIRSNFAIMSMLSVVSRLRRSLGIKQAGKIVTHEMMNAYSQLAAVPDHDRRMTELDHWLEQYGHRGPLESDPAQPRFQEMRDRLQKDLERAQPGRSEHNDPSPNWLFRPLFVLDEVREGFRDQNMKWWQRLRNRILEEANLAVKAGHLETVDDVFFLRGDDFKSDPSGWKNQVDKRKTKIKVASSLILPDTSSRDEIEAAIANDGHDKLSSETSLKIFRGIGLGTRTTTGTAVVAKSLSELLGGVELPENPILVAATLEPSWAVVFPRFEGVVVELGGELSHASILLREARIPSIVNASKAYQTINSGDRLMIDPRSGTIQILDKT
jgi:pyruvate,water dikinase